VGGPFATEGFAGAFGGPKENEEGGAAETFVFDGGAAARGGALCAKKLGIAGLDGGGPLPEGVGASFWFVDIGAVGKENEGPEAARVVLFSDLSLVSLGRVSEEEVGNLKNEGVLVESATRVSAFGG
jgi:hypothetical protein